jgi:hypothetical protein
LEMTKLLEQCSSDERNGAKVVGEGGRHNQWRRA